MDLQIRYLRVAERFYLGIGGSSICNRQTKICNLADCPRHYVADFPKRSSTVPARGVPRFHCGRAGSVTATEHICDLSYDEWREYN